jgi:hypothetical protein
MTGQVRTKRLAAVAVLPLVAAGLAGCGGSNANAATVVRVPAGALLVPVRGTATAAAAGEVVPPGATVLAGPGGGTVLATAGRTAILGPRAHLVVRTTGAETLISGDVVVQRGDGPALVLTAGAAAVRDLGGAVRVDREVAVRVAAYDGRAAVSTDAGSVTVAALHQVLVPGAALPAAAAPLSLSDDALDRSADPSLVAADQTLDTLAAGLNAEAGSQPLVASALAVAVPAGYTQVPVAASAAERILPLAIARAALPARAGTGAVRAADARAVRLRQAGGSWGVVAALLRAPLASVATALAAVEDAAVSGSGRVTSGLLVRTRVAAAAGPAPGAGASGVPPTVAAAGPAAGPAVAPSPGPSAAPSATPRPRPSATASPSPTSPGSVVAQLLDTVGKLLPTPGTAPTGSATGGLGGLL